MQNRIQSVEEMKPAKLHRFAELFAMTVPHRTNRTARRLVIALALTIASLVNAAAATEVPVYDHVVIVIMENHSYDEIIGNADAPYINSLAAQGANFTQYFAVAHPSQPNYIALFSGSAQGVTDDQCPFDFTGIDNLGAQLIAAGLSFTGYSEDLPQTGFTGCSSGLYARKHNPWVDFDTVPSSGNQPLTLFPTDYSTLPTLAFVIPNLCNDMHNCSVATGDAWLQSHLDGYVQWATTHNSLFVLTWDEDDHSQNNRIATVLVGAHVVPGSYADTGGHYRTLATLEAMYGLPPLGQANGVAPITTIWSDVIFTDGFEPPNAPIHQAPFSP
ncbi:MAG: alkaline phosphatase family protein [Rhodanobacteraceae bacterium]